MASSRSVWATEAATSELLGHKMHETKEKHYACVHSHIVGVAWMFKTFESQDNKQTCRIFERLSQL